MDEAKGIAGVASSMCTKAAAELHGLTKLDEVLRRRGRVRAQMTALGDWETASRRLRSVDLRNPDVADTEAAG